MELTLFFIGAAVVLYLISRTRNNADRLEHLEEQVQQIKINLARDAMERKKAEFASEAEAKPTPAPEPEPAKDPTSSAFSAAKEAAAEPKPVPEEITALPRADDAEPTEEQTPPPPPAAIPSPAPRQESAPLPPRRKPAEPETKPLIEWRPVLEKLYLWPPSGENAEAALVGWWVTRIGMLLLVISAAFFGVWVAKDIAPEIRVAGLAGVAAGLTFLGAWLERRLKAFGRVISAGGLALGYFTAFAAFALPAMKVIEDPVLGVAVQIGALAIAIGWSLWKRDETVAAMAILLGYVSCGFSHHHDLDNLVIGGLLLLAAGGGVLLVMRRWLWTHAIASAGSWGGLVILALGEWSQIGQAPPFSILLGSLLLLAMILEAANCLADIRFGDDPETRPRERKLLSVFNTSAAIAAGWLACEMAYPEMLAWFFLAFAILLFAIAGIRFWRGSTPGLTETFFLKAIALLAFFFVERFDGPTRWISLAVECGAVLWAYYRTRSRWVELAFGAVFAGTLGLIINDLTTGLQSWPLFSVASFAGAASFVLLSAVLGFHSFWTSGNEKLKSFLEPKALEFIRLIAAVAVGFAAAQFCSRLSTESPGTALPFGLSILALALAAPAVFLRRFPSLAAGTAALVPAYLMITQNFVNTGNGSGIVVSAWLAVLGFGLAEAAFHFWQKRWHAGNIFRAGFTMLGLGALGLATASMDYRWAIAEIPGMLLAGVFAAVGGMALILMRRPFSGDHLSAGDSKGHQYCQKGLAIAAGGLATLVTLQFFDAGPWFNKLGELSPWLALTGAILFSAAFWTRNAVPALAGGIPFALGLAAYLLGFDEKSFLKDHLICAAVLVAVGSGAALILNRRIDLSKQRSAAVSEKILHAISLLVIHWIFRSHFALSEIFFYDSLLAIGCVLAGAVRPLRNLPLISSLPVALVLIHAGVSIGNWSAEPRIFWWFAAAVTFGWIWLANSKFSIEKSPALTNRPALPRWHGLAAAAVLTLSASQALAGPWHLVALSGFGLALAALWRWQKIESLHLWSFIPAAFAMTGTLTRVAGNVVVIDSTDTLIAISLAATLTVIHGVIFAFRNPAYRNATWLTGGIPLALVFLAYASGKLGVSEMTTVCWGVSAVLLFVAGLVAGLRPYRMIGLIGLTLCLFRMFVFDINDPLYRIIAFFGIAVVLLAMGYLYHRFRHWIEQVDNPDVESQPPA